MVGNPPFLGGKRIIGAAGTDYREYIVDWLADGTTGNADLVTYFFLRGRRLSATDCGFLATNTISQGDTREVGLDQLDGEGWTIHPRRQVHDRGPARPRLRSPRSGCARTGGGVCASTGTTVAAITSSLRACDRATGQPPTALRTLGKQSFIGSYRGRNRDSRCRPDEASGISSIDMTAGTRDVLFPYLNGEDLNTTPSSRHEVGHQLLRLAHRAGAAISGVSVRSVEEHGHDPSG